FDPSAPLTFTLFPYTTLFRSPKHSKRLPAIFDEFDAFIDLLPCSCGRMMCGQWRGCLFDVVTWHFAGRMAGEGIELSAKISFLRSEEHTSELQSRFDLVCRLL